MATTMKRDSMDATVDDTPLKSTTTHQDTSRPASKPRLGLTDLPPSVRNTIYKYALDIEDVNMGKPNVAYTHTIKDGVLQFQASRPSFPVVSALFYVNKRISKEALHYFYAQNLLVRLEIWTDDARHAKTMLEDSGVLFSVADVEHVERSKRHCMDVRLVEKDSQKKRVVVLFPAQYLPRLITFMSTASQASKAWAPTHALSLTVKNTYDFPIAKLQGDLLEPFRLLTNLGAVTVNSANLLPGFAEGLQASMTAADFTIDALLSTINGIVDRGQKAFEKRDLTLSQQHFQSAIIVLTYGYLTRAETLHTQPESFSKAVQRTRWQCELGVAKALYHQHERTITAPAFKTATANQSNTTVYKDLLVAEEHISHALSLSTDSPSPTSNPWFKTLPAELIPSNKPGFFTDAERGESWYVAGLVHMGLGEHLFAAGDLERAGDLWPGGKGVGEAFDRARRGIDWEVKPGDGIKRAVGMTRGLDGWGR
ncbi:hypothetical protein P154DRAFT_611574 [Amniculicola lignicola CBS 123094]|uniref:Uncharacterized protein n=1 Tax=Amniculicola lignicola CBS 123094 TaxID=1392246 RepID=A0A6A5WY57_9PLEO|nr:hypothetical protein P154DRAFT_611574 [Amniculicola lignicola CBS 123094]